MESNDWFGSQLIDGIDLYTLRAIIYLGDKITTRTSLIRLKGQPDIFEDWGELQV